jgi:hypothetical protein
VADTSGATTAATAMLSGNVSVSVTVDGGAKPAWVATQQYSVEVDTSLPPLHDRGDSNASLLTRVRWLNSRFGLDDITAQNFDLPAPFTAPAVAGSTISLFSKRISVDPGSGMLSKVEVSTPPYPPRSLFKTGKAMELRVIGSASTSRGGWCSAVAGSQGMPAHTTTAEANISITTTGAGARWSTLSTACGVDVNVSASLFFDGYTEYVVTAAPSNRKGARNETETETETENSSGSGVGVVELDDIRLSLPLAAETCRYHLRGGGSGQPGSNIGAATSFDWKWGVGRCDNSFWVGSVQAGVSVRKRGFVRVFVCACVTIYLLYLQVRFSCHIAYISHITYHISHHQSVSRILHFPIRQLNHRPPHTNTCRQIPRVVSQDAGLVGSTCQCHITSTVQLQFQHNSGPVPR